MTEQPKNMQPHSVEAEHAVLGALMLDNDAFDRLSDLGIVPEAFYLPLHRAVWTSIVTLITGRKPADLVTVSEDCGADMAYLNAMVSSIPSSANVRRYAQIVAEHHLARQLIRAAGDISAEAAKPGDVLAKVDRAVQRIAALGEVRRDAEPVGMADAMVGWMDHLQAESEGRSRIFPTGLHDLDKLLNGGLREGEVMVIGARPKMGKTALMLALQRSMAQDYSTLVLSMEMPRNELISRHVAALGDVGLSRLRRPDPADDDMWGRVVDASDRLRGLHMAFDDQRALTLLDVRRKALQCKRRHGLDVMFVDFLQLMAGDGDNRNQELDRIANGLKALAGEMHIAIVLLSQLSREADKRTGPPVMTDLRDSGAIEAAADIIALLYREFAHPLGSKAEELKHFAQLEVVQRNGSPGTVGIHFDGVRQRFSDWDGAWPTTGRDKRSTSYAKGGLS